MNRSGTPFACLNACAADGGIDKSATHNDSDKRPCIISKRNLLLALDSVTPSCRVSPAEFIYPPRSALSDAGVGEVSWPAGQSVVSP
jgi:hypothetical protein